MDIINFTEAIMKKFILGILIWISVLVSVKCQSDECFGNLCLNEVQIIGSHNSYKIAIDKELWNIIFQKDSNLAYSLQYEHPSISEQLTLGLRSIEIDLFHDPEGGKYSDPFGLSVLKQMQKDTKPFDEKDELRQPGFKIFHIQDLDFRSHNLLFKNLLLELKSWSGQNKNHLPVIITINAKDQVLSEPNIKIPLPFTRTALDSIDIEIRSVLPESQLITPELVQGKFPTLEEAILNNGWPEIDSVCGRFMFVLDETGDKLNNYLNPDGSLTGKVMFVNSTEGNHSAAFRIVNEPIENEDYIKELVKKGYIVRTRTDAETKEARENNYVRFNKAVESGAQIITTDYYIPSKLFNSDYQVIFPDKSYVKKNDFLINPGN